MMNRTREADSNGVEKSAVSRHNGYYLVDIKVHPRSSQNRLEGPTNHRFIVKITAPAEAGKPIKPSLTCWPVALIWRAGTFQFGGDKGPDLKPCA